MAAQQSRRLLRCFVLVHYSESLKDLTQAGHPPAAEPAWGWELLESRAGSCVLAGVAISSHLPGDTFWRLRKRARGDGLVFDGSKHEILPNCFLAFLPVWGQRDVETSKK